MTLAWEELEHLGWFHLPCQSAQTQIATSVTLADFVFFAKGNWGKSLEMSFFCQLSVTAKVMGRNPFLTLNEMTGRGRLQHTEQNKMVLSGTCPTPLTQKTR